VQRERAHTPDRSLRPDLAPTALQRLFLDHLVAVSAREDPLCEGNSRAQLLGEDLDHIVRDRNHAGAATAAGRFTLTILAALASLEREQTAERTRLALEHVARQGRARSRFIPFGWTTASGGVEQEKGDRQQLVSHKAEQRVLGRIPPVTTAGCVCEK